MAGDTEHVGVAVLRATMATLAAAVKELTDENRRDREDLVLLRAAMEAVKADVAATRGRVDQIAAQIAPNHENIERALNEKLRLRNTLDALHARLDQHEKQHVTIWTKAAGILFWALAGLVGFVCSVAGEWIKLKVMGP